MPITKSSLSVHDQQVLESVFNPLELTSSLEHQVINSDNTNFLNDIDDETNCSHEALKQSKQLEMEAVKLAEEQNMAEALQKFMEAIQLTPKRSSIYNNRAQAFRLAARDDAAFEDLNQALELAGTRPTKTRCHALCQRGVLYRKQDKLDDARRDFEEAARMGSKFAKQQLVEINPFAALCNHVLQEAFKRLETIN